MSTEKSLGKSTLSEIPPPLGSSLDDGRGRCSAEAGRALIQTILRRPWSQCLPSCTVVSGTRSDLERIHSLLAGEPSLQPSSGKSPLVSIELPPEPIFPRAYLNALCQELTGAAPDGSLEDVLRHAQRNLCEQSTSIIAVTGLDDALAGRNPIATDRFFKLILPSLRPEESGRDLNFIITCDPKYMNIFAASDALWDSCTFTQIKISDVKPDDSGNGDLTDFVAIGSFVWGKGRTAQEARANMENADGNEVGEYEIWHAHKSCEVGEHGKLLTKWGHSRPQKLFEVSCGR